MTWSIIARDPASGHLGIAVASRFFAVGSLVPNIRPGTGAVCTQAFVNPLWGPDGLDLLAAGRTPAEAMAELAARDRGAANRQAHGMDAEGTVAAHTGEKCIDWAGHVSGRGVSVAGNMLAGPQVVEATLAEWESRPELAFADRFLVAMAAGEAAGGDKRGRQSAALRIHRTEAYPWLDLRADDHADPLAELRRLLAVARERYLLVAETMATRANPHGVLDRTDIDRRIVETERARIAARRPSASFGTPLKID